MRFWGKWGALTMSGTLLLYALFIFFTLPDVDDIGALVAAESTIITDRFGTELYRIHGDEDRTFIPLGRIADSVKKATIAIEDQRFYDRGCFDPRAFLRAVLRNLTGGFGSQGGSTITQQFAKHALIGSRKKRITRKLKEYVLSCNLEHRYSKDDILELYLNRIPYGQNVHGVEQAAHTYFAKSASGLTLAESAVLAALPQIPAYYNPYGKHVKSIFSEEGEERWQKGKIDDASDLRDEDFWMGLIGATVGGEDGIYIGGRTDQVLRNMQDQGFISEEERLQALHDLQTVTFKRERENIRAPHFVFAIREQVEEMFRGELQAGFLESGGLKITTTLDWRLQESAENITRDAGKMNKDLYGAHNAALLAADIESGHILAYVGNRDYWDEESDGNVDIIRSPRQPGSSFKPFAYAAAFLRGANPSTVLYDIPLKIGDDEPDNFDLTFWGPLTIRRALGASRNIPAAESFFLAGGEDAVISLVDDMGLPTVRERRDELSISQGRTYEYGWPLALGAAEVPLQEMVRGYLTFARGGKNIPLTSILQIEDRLGNILYKAPDTLEERDVLDPRISYMITSILSDVSVRPSDYWRTQLSIPGFETAAKTGTSNKCLKRAPAEPPALQGKCIDLKPDNNWTIGYTPNIVAGAWVGNASGGAMYVKASGLDTASHIWRPFMIAAHKTLAAPKTTFSVPTGLVSTEVSELSGKLAAPCTPLDRRRADFFFEGQVPKESDDACKEAEIDKLTKLLASDDCPAEAREKGTFFEPHSIFALIRPEIERSIQRWAEELSAGTGSIFRTPTGALRGSGAFLPLPLPLLPKEKCTLDLTPGRLEKPTVRILAPSEESPGTYPIFQPRMSYTVGKAVSEVLYELDGKIVARALAGTSLNPRIRLTRRFDPSGLHMLKVTLIDSYFNQVSDTVRFRFTESADAPSEEAPVD
jgi:membrane peptidoglycan carboxypeptidase